ncbi:unnamed protein product [Prunus armeniaca]
MVIDCPEVRPEKSDQQDTIKSNLSVVDLDQFIRLQKEGLAAESLSPLAAGPFSFPRWHEERVHFTSSSSWHLTQRLVKETGRWSWELLDAWCAYESCK